MDVVLGVNKKNQRVSWHIMFRFSQRWAIQEIRICRYNEPGTGKDWRRI